MRYISASEKQTFALAKKFAKTIKRGEVIGLIGNLGAGKTIFTKGLAAGLGIKQHITSPTFVLMKIYKIKKIQNSKFKIQNFIHIDAYRLKSAQDLIGIGAPEYFGRPDTVTVIEWADRVKKVLPRRTRLVRIKPAKQNSRYILLPSKFSQTK